MDLDVCRYRCGECGGPKYVYIDSDDGKWYVVMDRRISGTWVDGEFAIHIEDASEAVRDAALFHAPKNSENFWYLDEIRFMDAMCSLEMAGDSACPKFFEHFCHDLKHRYRLEKFGKWMEMKKAIKKEKNADEIENA